MKTENDMSDKELEEHEEKTKITHDKWDKLEEFRLKLNNSRCQQMYVIKRSSNLGEACPYYKTAKRLFIKDEQLEVLKLLADLYSEFEQDIKHVR